MTSIDTVIAEAFRHAFENGYGTELIKLTPEQIMEDMVSCGVFSVPDYGRHSDAAILDSITRYLK